MNVCCRIRRGEPDGPTSWVEYDLEVAAGTTVLELLRAISVREPGLGFTPHHCKTGICSACVLLVNGRRRLACRTPVTGETLALEPVPGLPLIKDLLVDLLPLYSRGGKRDGAGDSDRGGGE